VWSVAVVAANSVGGKGVAVLEKRRLLLREKMKLIQHTTRIYDDFCIPAAENTVVGYQGISRKNDDFCIPMTTFHVRPERVSFGINELTATDVTGAKSGALG
jgi:hypothetical protein